MSAMILDHFPSAEEFYATYWCKKPFIVKNYVDAAHIDSAIPPDELAGLAMEEGIKSRLITNNAKGSHWDCQHGPFVEADFKSLGDENWSLLVQNVEQYHAPTAELFKPFHVSPRWLIDDIMISHSAPGGCVGPHVDSYHTFLLQGEGKRAWKISAEPVEDQTYAEGFDVKVLKNGFEGETFEVTKGDVIYMPPFFGHEGKTIEQATTFSIGFLGPKLSEILGEYAHYLEDNEAINARYFGSDLNASSAVFTLNTAHIDTIKDTATSAIQSDNFTQWLTGYLSQSSHEEHEENVEMTANKMKQYLQNGDTLCRPEYAKIAMTKNNQGDYIIGCYGEIITVSAAKKHIVDALNNGDAITAASIKDESDLNLIAQLYTLKALSLTYDDD